jgi:hypothetical protein
VKREEEDANECNLDHFTKEKDKLLVLYYASRLRRIHNKSKRMQPGQKERHMIIIGAPHTSII